MSDVMDEIKNESTMRKKSSKKHIGSGMLKPNRKVYITKNGEYLRISCEEAAVNYITKGWRFCCKKEGKAKSPIMVKPNENPV